MKKFHEENTYTIKIQSNVDLHRNCKESDLKKKDYFL